MIKYFKKGNKIDIDNNEFIQSFEVCKNISTNKPILQYPNLNKKFIITTDASDYSIGSVLNQGTIPHDRPVAYTLRTLNDTESRYSTIEKECLSIIYACKTFRHYIYGRKFLFTPIYHGPLLWLFNIKEPNSQLLDGDKNSRNIMKYTMH